MRRALAILALARAYEVYENEYANDVLPGGRGDDDLPNLPYAVDANRYSDGVSSVSPLTDTAPAFPLHRGAVSDAPAGRRRLALAKVQSEIEQGVVSALYDAYEDDKAELDTARLVRSLQEIIPLSFTMKEGIDAMREWAGSRARMASSSTASDPEASPGRKLEI